LVARGREQSRSQMDGRRFALRCDSQNSAYSLAGQAPFPSGKGVLFSCHAQISLEQQADGKIGDVYRAAAAL